MKIWSITDSSKLYNIENWGEQYFGINSLGRLTVNPRKDTGIELKSVVEKIRGLGLPVLIRFQDMIRHRVVNEAFRKSIDEFNYKGNYQGVYPIKVNQMREVVEEILDAGRPYHFGLEAGSKAELAAVIAMNTTPQSLVLCNGYKDYSFIKTALLGLKMGKRVIIIVEKLSELDHIIQVARELGVSPLVGMRTRLEGVESGSRVEGNLLNLVPLNSSML